LKIAQVATSWLRVPPENYGGAEAVIHQLTEGLLDRGHVVTLFSAGDAKTRAKIVSCIDKSPGLNNENTININFRSRYYKTTMMPLFSEERFDLIHWHISYDLLPYLTAQLSKDIPAVITFHNYYDNTEDIFSENSKSYNIALSKSFHAQVPVKFFATVYNGINIKDFAFNPDYNGQKIVWIGRFSPVKGVDIAINIADKTKTKLTLAGQKKKTDYFVKTIEPAIKKSGYVDFIGPVAGIEKSRVLGEAKLFINPIRWDEPFGLVVPEANACGTPVVAYARGAMSELIKDGFNGHLVKPGDIDGMIKAAKKIYDMPEAEYRQMRANCREHVEKNFTVEKMVDGYEAVYKRVIADFKRKH